MRVFISKIAAAAARTNATQSPRAVTRVTATTPVSVFAHKFPKFKTHRAPDPTSTHETLLNYTDTPQAFADAAVPELPVPRRFRDASRTPRSSTTNGAEPTARTELFASVADRFPDASRCNISLSSQAWDQASPKAGPGLSEVKFEAS